MEQGRVEQGRLEQGGQVEQAGGWNRVGGWNRRGWVEQAGRLFLRAGGAEEFVEAAVDLVFEGPIHGAADRLPRQIGQRAFV